MSFSIILVIFYLHQDFTKWSIVKLINANAERLYVDSFTVLFYSECYDKIGTKVFEVNNSCSNWIYGSFILRVFSFLNIFNVHEIIGHFFTFIILSCFVYIIIKFKGNVFAQINLFLGFISPPVWLLLERANFDVLIFLFVFLSGLFYSSGHKKTSLLLILLSTLIKFYTLPILILLFFFLSKKIDKIISVVYILVSIFFMVDDLSRMQGSPIQAGYNHFGMKIIGNYLGKIDINFGIFQQYIISLILFVAVIILLFRFVNVRKDNFIQFPNNNLLHINGYLFCYIVFISCFMVGLSVDYRLIFYVTSAGFFLPFIGSQIRIIYSVIFFLSVWLTYPSGYLQTLGDFFLEITAAFHICILLLLVKKFRKVIF